MSKAALIVVLGIIIVLIPIDGLPDRVSTALTVLAGLSVIVLGILLRFERLWLLRARDGGHKTDAYVEQRPPIES